MNETPTNNHLKIGELPVLRVVNGDKLIFHEHPDDERLLNLVDRLGADGILKNPPIVASISDNSNYIILDGANRITALKKLGFRHFMVQVVTFYDDLLTLHCWNHVIEKLGRDHFMENIGRISGVKLIDDGGPESDKNRPPDFSGYGGSFCHFMFNEGKSLYIAAEADFTGRVELLMKITDLYIHRPIYDRVSYSSYEHLQKHYPDFRALLTFRRLKKEDFLELIRVGKKLPAGITRVFLPKRALGLNTPLEFLKSDLTLDEKNRWLDDMILKRVRDKSIRFYREPTFVFDE